MKNGFNIAIVEAIAEAEGVESTALGFTIYDYIDIDAVEALKQHEKSSWTLSFAVPNYTVTVTSDGIIDVEPISRFFEE